MVFDEQTRLPAASLSGVTPRFMLRIGGLPTEEVERLHFSGSVACADAVVAVEVELDSLRDGLLEDLQAGFDAHRADARLRGDFLALKREVFNRRKPKSATATRAVRDALPAGCTATLDRWLGLWAQHEALGSDFRRTFDAEIVEKRHQLKSIVTAEDFRKGLLLASPSLDDDLDAYVASDVRAPSSRARHRERSLVEYVERIGCKTSPFSTLTAVAVGSFGATQTNDSTGVSYRCGSMEKVSHTRLNVSILSDLSSVLIQSDGLRDDLRVRLVPGWQVLNGRVRYLRTKKMFDEPDQEGPVALSTIKETLFHLPGSRLLTAFIEIMEDGCPRRLGELCRELAAQVGGSTEDVMAYLQHFVRLRFLVVPELAVATQSRNPLEAFCRQLVELDSPLTSAVADRLEAVDRKLRDYDSAPVPSRRRILKEARSSLQNCYAVIGQPDARVPRTLIYEDTTVPVEATVDRARWEHTLGNLRELQGVLPIFDIVVRRRLVTKGFFRRRYGAGGRCDDFVAFADQYHQDFFTEYLRHQYDGGELDEHGRFARTRNHFRQGELDLLDEGRQVVADLISRACENRGDDQSDVVLDDEFVQTVSRYVPADALDFQSNSFFAQLCVQAGEPRLVVNRVYMGLTAMFSRFAHIFDGSTSERGDLVSELRRHLLDAQPAGAVLAEMKGGHDTTNLNLHPPVTPFEIVCPGDVTERPEAEQIALTDLFICDDRKSDRLQLRSTRLGKEVIPVYLGLLVPMILPEVQQVLLNFSVSSICPINLWLGTRASGTGPDKKRYPRIRYKNVVLNRALWKVDPRSFPHRDPQGAPADFFAAVHRWRRHQEIPRRCFLTAHVMPEGTKDGATAGHQDRPLYVDFESYFSVSVLEGTLRRAKGIVVFTEMLPDRDDLWLRHEGQSYVTEFVFELNRVRGDRT